jgi:hypothetical protein
MAHWARDFTLAGSGAQWPVAAAFTGGVFASLVELTDLQPTVVKMTTAGAITWQRKYTLPSSNTINTGSTVACNADGSRVAMAVDDTSGGTTVYMLDGADGDILWETSLPMRMEWFYEAGGGKSHARRLAVDSNDDVVLVGLASAGASHFLVKLLGTDGSIDWRVDILDRTSLSSSTQEPRQVAIDSDDDIIVATIGDSTDPVIYKFLGTDGSLVWARELNFDSTFKDYLACVDPSDNVYAAGKGTSSNDIRVIKLDTDGATLWEADLDLDPAATSINVCGGLAADAASLYIPMGVNPSGSVTIGAAVVTLNAAGTAASCVYYDPTVSNDWGAITGVGGVSVVSGSMYLAATRHFHDTFYYDSVIYRRELPDLGVGDYDPGAEYVGIEIDVVVSAGSATATSFTPDFDAPATLTPASSTSSAGAITYTSDLYELAVTPGEDLIRFAESLGPTTQFGTPRNSWSWPATSLGPSAQFGTPAYDQHVESQATSLGPTTQFGTPYSFIYFGDAPPHYVSSIPTSTAFGTPTGSVEGSYAAGEWPVSTAFGTPIATRIQEASSLGPTTQFGTPTLVGSYQAFGIASTAFGTPIATRFGEAIGFSGTAFGTPSTDADDVATEGSVSGMGPLVQFGTPVGSQIHLARSLGPTARFGTPYTVQGCP